MVGVFDPVIVTVATVLFVADAGTSVGLDPVAWQAGDGDDHGGHGGRW